MIRFSATNPTALPEAVAARLDSVIDGLPGVVAEHFAAQDDDSRIVEARFSIVAGAGMADAARDGSRLAKEALSQSGLGEAKLTELGVIMVEDGDA